MRYCGEHSIVIYLAFFIFMAGTRVLLFKTGLVPGIGLTSAIVTLAGVIGPLMLFWLGARDDVAVPVRAPGSASGSLPSRAMFCSRLNDVNPHAEERLTAASPRLQGRWLLRMRQKRVWMIG